MTAPGADLRKLADTLRASVAGMAHTCRLAAMYERSAEDLAEALAEDFERLEAALEAVAT